jgi:hypothetical protein
MIQETVDKIRLTWSDGVAFAVYRSVVDNTPYPGDRAEFPTIID